MQYKTTTEINIVTCKTNTCARGVMSGRRDRGRQLLR